MIARRNTSRSAARSGTESNRTRLFSTGRMRSSPTPQRSSACNTPALISAATPFRLYCPPHSGARCLFQAGSSSRGQKFALDNAEAIFAVQHTEAGMHKFMGEISALAESEGIAVPRVTFGVQVVLGDTLEQAEQHRREMAEHVSLDGSLARLSGTLGIDFSTQETRRASDDAEDAGWPGILQDQDVRPESQDPA